MRLNSAGAAIAAAMLLAASMAFAQQHTIALVVRQTAASSLTLISPTNAAFDSTLASYFPGLAEEESYQQAIRPYLVIARNDGSLTAMAYSIKWTAHYTDGFVRPLRAIFITRPLMYKPAVTSIPPGDLRLISPLFNVTSQEYQANSEFSEEYPASHFPYSQGLASVDVDVDGVVYADGSFIGPNKTHIAERCAAAQFAARDEARSVLNLIQSSTVPQSVLAQQLQQAFNQAIQREVSVHQENLLARYVSARGESAQDVRRILRNRGVSGMESLLQNFLERSGDLTSPSIFDQVYRNLSLNDPRVFKITP